MIKVFTKNKNGKIELTEKELKQLLDDSYWEGYRANDRYVYTTPNVWPYYSPYYWTSTGSSITCNLQDTTTASNTSMNIDVASLKTTL